MYSGFDDLAIIKPKKDSNFSGSMNFVPVEGGFENVFIYRKHLKGDKYFLNPYSVYSGGLYNPHAFNNDEKNKAKIMLVTDSFSCPIVPFL
ncbi:MAG: hypothetical protein GYA87_08950 [Christensenellaceae bacterium]|nr:hypothetical protein [Christensenellaceae bacterium]